MNLSKKWFYSYLCKWFQCLCFLNWRNRIDPRKSVWLMLSSGSTTNTLKSIRRWIISQLPSFLYLWLVGYILQMDGWPYIWPSCIIWGAPASSCFNEMDHLPGISLCKLARWRNLPLISMENRSRCWYRRNKFWRNGKQSVLKNDQWQHWKAWEQAIRGSEYKLVLVRCAFPLDIHVSFSF